MLQEVRKFALYTYSTLVLNALVHQLVIVECQLLLFHAHILIFHVHKIVSLNTDLTFIVCEIQLLQIYVAFGAAEINRHERTPTHPGLGLGRV